MQHRLNFRPLPQGHESLRPTWPRLVEIGCLMFRRDLGRFCDLSLVSPVFFPNKSKISITLPPIFWIILFPSLLIDAKTGSGEPAGGGSTGMPFRRKYSYSRTSVYSAPSC